MDAFGNDEIARLLRLKRYEQPPPAYFENFLHEFHRRQREELRHQPPWRICFGRAHGFALRHNVRSLVSYAAAIAAVLVCGAVVSIRIYQQPKPAQVTRQNSPPDTTRPPITDREFNLPPLTMPRTFDMQPTVLPANSRDVRMRPVLPADPLRSDEFVPLNLEWESLPDQSPRER
jgi:hypothetical protein